MLRPLLGVGDQNIHCRLLRTGRVKQTGYVNLVNPVKDSGHAGFSLRFLVVVSGKIQRRLV